MGYVASVRLLPITDGGQTFWEWRSRFTAPKSRQAVLEKLFAEEIFEAGFRAIKKALRGQGKASPVRVVPEHVNTLKAGGGDTAKAIVMRSHCGPEVLHCESIEVARPRQNEVRIRQRFIGVNSVGVYTRTGYFDLVAPPGIPGMEAAGGIESIGPGIDGFTAGGRVAHAAAPPGAYMDLRVMKPDFLVHVPDFLSDELAAASLLKGTTASFLLHDVYRVKPGDVVLVHAAAGGVGLLLVQWAKALGAKVIGTSRVKKRRTG